LFVLLLINQKKKKKKKEIFFWLRDGGEILERQNNLDVAKLLENEQHTPNLGVVQLWSSLHPSTSIAESLLFLSFVGFWI
jgi:hypothetical protein